MAQQTINVGAAPNDGTGTPLRTAFQYTNSNFSELYTAVGPSGNNIVVPGTATITGDLTVDTNVLKVDTTNNRVGIGTATPYSTAESLNARTTALTSIAAFATMPLTVTDSTAFALGVGGGINFRAKLTAAAYSDYAAIWSYRESASNSDYAGSLIIGTSDNSNGYPIERYRISSTGISTWSVAGTTAMTLNSTGLGVGGSVLAKISAYLTSTATYNSAAAGDDTDFQISRVNNSAVSGQSSTIALNSSSDNGATVARVYLACVQESNASYASSFTVKTRNSAGTSAERFRIDSSGNVGIGVTPSAWGSTYRALQIGLGSSIAGVTNDVDLNLTNNARFDGTNWKYLASSPAERYRIAAGTHAWYNAASGTGGNTITFTQAMTLDASGNLLVGTTSQNGSWNTKLTISNDSGTTKWAVGPYLGGVTNFLISAGASAGVYLNGTAATSWTSASDERLKDIIEPISNAVSKVASLRAVIGKFRFDENNTRKPFLIAQDIQAVLPEAVDASNPDKLGVAYTDVIPLLVAAIKELTARVQTLEAK